MNKITGQLIAKFEHDLDSDVLICVSGIEVKEIAWDTIFRAYIALGSSIQQMHSEERYNITSDDANAAFELLKAEMESEEVQE